jgi:putative transcriptional regulator
VTPEHHPSEELLLDHATGALAEAQALVVATHLALCPRCRADFAALEAMGAGLMEAGGPQAFDEALLEGALARLGEQEPPAEPAANGSAWPPRPLRDYLPAGLDALPWRMRLPGVHGCPLEGVAGGKVEMLRIQPGRAVPNHTHRGVEMTLVLEGGYSDELGHFGRGDVCVADGSITHRPHADRGPDCVCLTVTDGVLRFSGPFGWIVNPLQRG